VVVDDFHVEGVTASPLEAYSPLLTDPDAVLTFAISSQGLKPVPRGHAQIFQATGTM
jgi:hypothetical protein